MPLESNYFNLLRFPNRESLRILWKPALMARARNIKNSPMAPSPSFLLFPLSPLGSLLFSPKNRQSPRTPRFCSPPRFSLLFLSLLTFFSLLGFLTLFFVPISQNSVSSVIPATTDDNGDSRLLKIAMLPLPAHRIVGDLTEEEREFWRQPESEKYRPCLGFGIGYRRESARVSKEKRKFLVVVVWGGLNRVRNQIIDAVVIARILEAALVVPVFRADHVWGDESVFSDIFDVEHFKRTLQADVRVVSSLPSTHLVSAKTIGTQLPHHVHPLWIRARFLKQLKQEGVLVLKGLDTKLSKNLPPDLQKLRCKVAFHALRFATPVRELGNRLARRMWIEGPYVALHMRLEKDVWIRTGCLTGLGPHYDAIVRRDKDLQPESLARRLNRSRIKGRLAGLCPLNALEMARLLKALGATKAVRIYIAGGEPFGGASALKPLVDEFPNAATKETLAREGELVPYVNRSSILAAIDYIVSLSSDVFVPSYGGNMARAMQGHRAYVGRGKFIKPNKQLMLSFIEEAAAPDAEFSYMMKNQRMNLQGRAELRTNNRARDVVAYPVPECMCKQ